MEMDAALQILESGHNLQEAFDGFNFLATNERWDLRNLSARTESPMNWKWLNFRLETIPEELEKVREGLKNHAAILSKVPQTDGPAWNLEEASKAVEQARELMRKAFNSPERNALTSEMNQRPNLDRVPASAKSEAERLAGQVKLALDLLRKHIQTARERLAKLSPKIREIAAALAKEQEEIKKETTEQAEQTEQQKPEEAKTENQERLAEQQKLNQKVETLKDLLRAEANKQNILNPEERELMRDADDSLAMLKDPPPKAEQALQDATRAAGVEFTLNKGEGAFYGPKLEFVLKDAIGRDWQCGTWQVDLNMPGRLGAHYIDGHSEKRTPVMLHRAIFGSLERFLGILIEHHAGRLPAWLAPVQAVVMNITDNQIEYVQRVTESLKKQGLRVESDLRNEKVGFKIREHTLQRVPYLLVAGDREAGSHSLAVRTRSGKDLGAIPVDTIAQRLAEEVATRGRTILEV